MLLQIVAIIVNNRTLTNQSFPSRSAVRVSRGEQNKPLVVLVHDSSVLRLWMEKSLSKLFRICVFSNSEDALTFAKSTQAFDLLITDLDLALSALGGCNVARDVRARFPQVPILVFSDVSPGDHRLLILKGMKGIRFMSKPFDALLIARRAQAALSERAAVTS